ncbi:hypothetical protein GCM10022265_41640 [Marinobacter xestospongiae]
MEINPMAKIMMDTTAAKIGRSTKNREKFMTKGSCATAVEAVAGLWFPGRGVLDHCDPGPWPGPVQGLAATTVVSSPVSRIATCCGLTSMPG